MTGPFKLKKKKDFNFGNKEADYSQKRDFHKKFDYSGEPDPSHEPPVTKPNWGHSKIQYSNMDDWYKEEDKEVKRTNP